MKIWATLAVAFTAAAAPWSLGKGIEVELDATASSSERLAAKELESYLARMYPDASGKHIRLTASLPLPESYKITGTIDDAVIAGGGPRGVLYGAYALLEKLGCRFYLSGDVVPPARKEPLSFKGLKLSNRPLTPTRLLLDWHNFLSGCSTWNLPEWQQYVSQSMKMGYNTLMVHSYANNPMEVYGFNGKTKSCGWLPTTIKGRDWHTPHVNDVRRMVGGSAFDAAVFGSDAAIVPDEQRHEAAKSLMLQAFDFARERGMEVCWSLDVDDRVNNPQELLGTLPEEARIYSSNSNSSAAQVAKQLVASKKQNASGLSESNLVPLLLGPGMNASKADQWLLANPDHPEGYRFYKARIETLLREYPQITSVAAWFSMGGTPLLNLKLEEMPLAWQETYRQATANTPAGEDPAAPGMLGIAKITKAFRRALDEIGRPDVRLAVGTWNFNPSYLAGLDLFLPPDVPFIGLDYNIHSRASTLTTPGRSQDAMAKYASRRPLTFVIWAQGDDAGYHGRSFTPFPDFSTKLENLNINGFGVIHWATRPFDLYFRSHIRQVWQGTRNEPLKTTCADMAEHLLGDKGLGDYLQRWVTEAPIFGTSAGISFPHDYNKEKIVQDCDERLKMLGTGGCAEVAYYRRLETFSKECAVAYGHYDNARKFLEKDDWAAAREALVPCAPEKAIEIFANSDPRSPLTRGELGQIATFSLQWLPTVSRLRQMTGIEPIRCNFAPIWPGGQTRFIDEEGKMWDTLGAERLFNAPDADKEIGRHGLESAKPVTLAVNPIAAGDFCPENYKSPAMKEGNLCPGEYRLRLLLLDPDSTAPGQRVFKVTVEPRAGETDGQATTVDIFKEAGGKNRLWELALPVTLSKTGTVTVTLAPVKGSALVSGLVLERTGDLP